MAEAQEYIGEVLVRRGVVPPERLAPLYETMKERGQALTDLLVSTNVTDEAKIAQALADECGVSLCPRSTPTRCRSISSASCHHVRQAAQDHPHRRGRGAGLLRGRRPVPTPSPSTTRARSSASRWRSRWPAARWC